MALSRLKIGRACYRVRNRELHPDLYGQIDLGRKLLDIADDLEGEEAVCSLVHEVLHRIWAHRGMPARLRETGCRGTRLGAHGCVLG